MRDPIFSVVVPTYNYGRFIGRCIESVLTQTYADWELIITDDCSTDNTEDVVRGYRDPRVRYVRNATRLGMYPNFRCAIAMSRGQYIKPLPSDDFLLPRCLESFHRVFSDYPDMALATCGVEVVDWQGNSLGQQTLPGAGALLGVSQVAKLVSTDGCVFGGNSQYCFPRATYERVGGYPTKITYSGDFGLAALLVRIGSYYAFSEVLVGGRIHGSQSGVRDTGRTVHIQDRFRVYDLLFASHLELPDASTLRLQARRRETGLYAAIAMKAFVFSGERRQWALMVLKLLREEMSVPGVIQALLAGVPSLLHHFLLTRSAGNRQIVKARRKNGTGAPSMEPDRSVKM